MILFGCGYRGYLGMGGEGSGESVGNFVRNNTKALRRRLRYGRDGIIGLIPPPFSRLLRVHESVFVAGVALVTISGKERKCFRLVSS